MSSDSDAPSPKPARARASFSGASGKTRLVIKQPTTSWVELVMQNEAGEPVKDTSFQLSRDEEVIHEGTLDGQGTARVEDLAPGLYAASFPDLPDEQVELLPDEQPVWRTETLTFDLKDHTGAPVTGEPFRVRLMDGTYVEGQTDDTGHAEVTDLFPGPCTVEFPNFDVRGDRLPDDSSSESNA